MPDAHFGPGADCDTVGVEAVTTAQLDRFEAAFGAPYFRATGPWRTPTSPARSASTPPPRRRAAQWTTTTNHRASIAHAEGHDGGRGGVEQLDPHHMLEEATEV